MDFVLTVVVVFVAWCVYNLGWLRARMDVHVKVFGPWLDSIQVSDPHYWLRRRDYKAARDAFFALEIAPMRWFPLRVAEAPITFDTPPKRPDECVLIKEYLERQQVLPPS